MNIYHDGPSAENSHQIFCLMMADGLRDDPEVLEIEASSKVRAAANQILNECGGDVEAAFMQAVKQMLNVDEVVEVKEAQDKMGFDEIPF